MQVILIMAVGILIAGVIENMLNSARRRGIPIRIHVNGTRGKSTTTRLIAAGLREAGIRTIAKTTGSAARLILADGSETGVPRRGPANIREQMWLLAMAKKHRAEALVVECMALSPETQWVSEHRIIQSTIGVITNAGPDHFDEMGPGVEYVARALSRTIPRRGVLVTAEQPEGAEGVEGANGACDREALLSIFLAEASRQGTTVYTVDGREVPQAQLDRFSYPAFGDNVACALKACELAGVKRDMAFKGMLNAAPDPGTLKVCRLTRSGRTFYFVNALAANDLRSTGMAYERLPQYNLPAGLPVVGILNIRGDRSLRTSEMIAFAKQEGRFERLILLGPDALAKRLMGRKCLIGRKSTHPTTHPHAHPHALPEEILDLAAEGTDGDLILFAFGNIKGAGERLLNYFETNGATQP